MDIEPAVTIGHSFSVIIIIIDLLSYRMHSKVFWRAWRLGKNRVAHFGENTIVFLTFRLKGLKYNSKQAMELTTSGLGLADIALDRNPLK